MVDAKRPGGSGQAAVPRERQENPDILPVDRCAFSISH
jgi:hypothetical protein